MRQTTASQSRHSLHQSRGCGRPNAIQFSEWIFVLRGQLFLIAQVFLTATLVARVNSFAQNVDRDSTREPRIMKELKYEDWMQEWWQQPIGLGVGSVTPRF